MIWSRILELSEEEKKLIFNLPEFKEFVDLSTKYVERAINENFDILRDYKEGENVDEWVLFLLYDSFLITTRLILLVDQVF